MRASGLLKARQSLASYARPAVAVDLVILTRVDEALHVLLIRRGEAPFEGRLALPGGFPRVGDGVEDQGEYLDRAAAREFQEETGLEPGDVLLEQFATFGWPGRDPRMRVLSVAYYVLVRPELAQRVRAGGDATETCWAPVAAELRAVFSAVKGEPQDPGNFRRKVKRLVEDGVLETAPGRRRTASKPAALYRFRAAPGR